MVAVAICLATTHQPARADAVTDWNTEAEQLLVHSRLGTPAAVRVRALLETAVHEAVSGVKRLPLGQDAGLASDAAVAAANRIALSRLLPQQESAFAQAYRTSIDKLGNTPATAAGIAAGAGLAHR